METNYYASPSPLRSWVRHRDCLRLFTSTIAGDWVRTLMTQEGVLAAKTFSAKALEFHFRVLGVVVPSKIMRTGKGHGTLLTEESTGRSWDHGYIMLVRR